MSERAASVLETGASDARGSVAGAVTVGAGEGAASITAAGSVGVVASALALTGSVVAAIASESVSGLEVDEGVPSVATACTATGATSAGRPSHAESTEIGAGWAVFAAISSVASAAASVCAGAGTELRERGGAKKSAKLGRSVSLGAEPFVSRSLLISDPLMALSVLPCVLMGCPTTGRP
jgi:hypothetical protein